MQETVEESEKNKKSMAVTISKKSKQVLIPGRVKNIHVDQVDHHPENMGSHAKPTRRTLAEIEMNGQPTHILGGTYSFRSKVQSNIDKRRDTESESGRPSRSTFEFFGVKGENPGPG
mmetsp:Transcript_33373/g.51186  ORF Transcript_33373/g.51186 Transcript_33373/m.51186 type:complete len:117 (+) Transcript_33373:723-1073(+)|eukprot:CAMPEP_0170501934 /NCGR_PEP_ID=MMETSP0208-20121228/39905_1 /TAXON_ID=197538 /ORGANISM="Strombidium inclinatum, Strain S3" /LENGTH=116 /DNA_ID=CAMNT_0010780733 /DNA_START=159 /DNA_END=509 /DNA_ORIENTATION=+